MKISWWQWLPIWRRRVVGAAESADEVPDRLPRNGVALIGNVNRTKWICSIALVGLDIGSCSTPIPVGRPTGR